jgi:ribosomal protein L6P/L9E
VRGPTVEINGTRFTSYGSQGSKSSKPAQKMIDAELGDSFKRASRDEAMDMLKAQAQAQFRALIANARASRPDLADVPDSELLAAMMR